LISVKFDMHKRGQISIFVIIAIIIVAVVAVIFIVQPGGISLAQQGEVNPIASLKGCIEPEVQSAINLIAPQGGFANPQGFKQYQDVRIKYLCYTSEFYKTCTVQVPFVKNSFENELKSILDPKIETCVSNLEQEYEDRGFEVTKGTVESEIDIAPSNINVNFIVPLTVRKGDDVSQFDEFNVRIDSQMYELLNVAQSILDFEAELGDTDTSLFNQFYPSLKMKKVKLGDGTTIYILTNVVTSEAFTFASRSLAWPPGYGF